VNFGQKILLFWLAIKTRYVALEVSTGKGVRLQRFSLIMSFEEYAISLSQENRHLFLKNCLISSIAENTKKLPERSSNNSS